MEAMSMSQWSKTEPAHILDKNLQDTTGLFVDETRDTLHTSTTSETTNSEFGDT
jgi:hypothetical protein